jgi:hypothetical protein
MKKSTNKRRENGLGIEKVFLSAERNSGSPNTKKPACDCGCGGAVYTETQGFYAVQAKRP